MSQLPGSEAATDIRFFRNTGIALVMLTVLAGSISLIGSLTTSQADTPGPSGYSAGAASVNLTEKD